jgi:alpha-L-fucosidase 2
MRSLRFFLPAFLSVLVCLSSCKKNTTPSEIIWSDKPATCFEEAFPLGNGFSGIMVRGGVPSEDLLLNESTLWTGGPVNPRMNPDAWKNLDGVRKSLFS